ncbi:hypothetical protein [Geochorda subterranea]|uniref:Transposase IS116/IS110/IS902 family protein n=1 Tax=Geochorda subterranea TaxID=3109564 RepID=A0ABZ1BMJ3_9FIRM|nr:hypothetical protein [Limnochorda sp. LNt]WRP13723.1 hypothetical protein VLY81_09755 [Limnochorda sp. LNt]
MGEVWRFKRQTAGAVTAWWLLCDIRRRQQSLRARWHRVSAEEIERELLAIAQRLIDVVPVLLPRFFGASEGNGRGSNRSDAHALDGQVASVDSSMVPNGRRRGLKPYAVGAFAVASGPVPDVCRILGLIPMSSSGKGFSPPESRQLKRPSARPSSRPTDRPARFAFLQRESQRLADDLHRVLKQLGLADERTGASS